MNEALLVGFGSDRPRWRNDSTIEEIGESFDGVAQTQTVLLVFGTGSWWGKSHMVSKASRKMPHPYLIQAKFARQKYVSTVRVTVMAKSRQWCEEVLICLIRVQDLPEGQMSR